MISPLAQAIATDFIRLFGSSPLLVRAPGRVNLIGEHTDYNNGFVLPAAIDKEIYFAVSLNGLDVARLRSHDLGETDEVSVSEPMQPGRALWANYLKGVVAQFQARGITVPGFDCVFGGTIPMGAGLSSSAAVECGIAYALDHLLGTQIDRLTLTRMSQLAEHQFAGVQCGIMDQFASMFGQAGHVVRLDCRSLDYAYFPFDSATYGLVLCNSGVKHSLASSEYNTRRQECEAGVAVLHARFPEVQSLRDATAAQVAACRAEMGDVVYRRSRYIVEENQRVVAACEQLTADDMTRFGQLMYASHAGLRDDFEVSCHELDVLVEIARTAPVPVLGARMMGGGFGGCTINLLANAHVEAFVAHATAAYAQRLDQPLVTYRTTIVGGVELI
jgi:galactokinase